MAQLLEWWWQLGAAGAARNAARALDERRRSELAVDALVRRVPPEQKPKPLTTAPPAAV